MAKTLSFLLDALPAGMVIAVSGASPGSVAVTMPVAESDAEVATGGIFVARRGLSVDGHDFIPRALDKGVAAVVGERPLDELPFRARLKVPYVQVRSAQDALGYLAAAYHGFPSRRLTLVGVTGTDGKTTTSTLIHSILQVATGGKTGLVSTIAADVGGKSLDTGLHVTTPSAPMVHMLLAQMVANKLTHCVLEMTSHGLAQGRLNGVDVDVAVLTNLTHEHLDYHGTFEEYRTAKGIMFDMLARAARKPGVPKISVVNADDANVDYFAAFTADKVLHYAVNGRGTYEARMVFYSPERTEFDVMHGSTRFAHVSTPLVGAFNVANCLAAATAAASLGVSAAHVQEGIARVSAIPGRMERIDEGQPFLALVDFAHTPHALERALEAARSMIMPGGRVIAVFGSAGLRDREKRRLMAQAGERLADFCVLTAEDPRTESLDDILQVMSDACMTQGGIEGVTFTRVRDRGLALYEACRMARPGDIVLACGKGHEQSMCFGTVEYPWDDREALREALRGTPLRTLPTAKGTGTLRQP